MKVKVKAFVHAHKESWQQTITYFVTNYADSLAGSIVLKQIEIEVDVDVPEDFDEKKRAARRESINQNIKFREQEILDMKAQLENLQ